MNAAAEFLLTLGGILLLGLLTSSVGRRTFLPRVTLLLLFGMLIGDQVLGLIPSLFTERFEIISNMALLMVGFLLGGRLTTSSLRQSMASVLWISMSAAIVTAIVVGIGLFIAGLSLELAILLGAISSATAPAAILDVVREFNHRNAFADRLLAIVTLDDAWALILFGFAIALVLSITGGEGSIGIWLAVREIGGAILLGLLLGFPAAYLTGRLRPGEPILSEALGLVFVCGGIAIWLEVSFLLAAIVMGAVIANFAKHHDYPFHAIEDIEWPFMVIFFILAGASLEISLLADLGLVAVVYVVCRAAGKIIGARIGAEISHASQETKAWMGMALLPQAGVAIGMALIASNYFPEHRQILLSVIISSTVFFEIVGPVFTRLAIQRTRGVL